MTVERSAGENTLFIRDNMGEYYGLPVRDLVKYRLSEEQVEELEQELKQGLKQSSEVSGYMPSYMQIEVLQGDTAPQGSAGWFQVSAFQWGVGRGSTSPTGGTH